MSFSYIRATSARTLALLALAASLLTIGLLSASADGHDPPEPELYEEPVHEEQLTSLSIEGVASRSVSYDGTVARFTISFLGEFIRGAVSVGNSTVQEIADAINANCLTEEPEVVDPDADPICVSPNGLQTTRIRIYEEFDWTEEGRVSQGFRYENGLRIAIHGTDYAGELVDLVINAGGPKVRFDGLDFTTSGRAEAERAALLDAIDDAQATVDSIAAHMGYEIVRIVELSPLGSLTASRTFDEVEAAAEAMADHYIEPTPVFGGSEMITSRVRIVYELRPLAEE